MGKESIRERNLPAPVVVYHVIALSLYMQSSCREEFGIALVRGALLPGGGSAVVDRFLISPQGDGPSGNFADSETEGL
jgi:hypothetical protein